MPGALVGEGERSRRRVAVGDPVVELLGARGSDVCGDVGLGPDEPAETHELVDPERVALRRMAARRHPVLPVVVRARPLGGGTDAVTPVVAVGEASAGPAQVGSAQALHVVDELLADAPEVGNLRIGADPDAVVDHASEVLDEVPVDVRADPRSRRRGIDLDLGIRRGQRTQPGEGRASGRGGRLQESTPGKRHRPMETAIRPSGSRRRPASSSSGIPFPAAGWSRGSSAGSGNRGSAGSPGRVPTGTCTRPRPCP